MKQRKETLKLVVHCAYTKSSMHIKAATVRKWHVEDNKWSDIGYHWFIRRNGFLEPGRAEDLIGSHARGYNSISIAVCLAGGMSDDGKSEDNFTLEQYETLREFIGNKEIQYPDIEVLGHRDLPKVTKDCPCFSVKDKMLEWKSHLPLNQNGIPSFSDELEGVPKHEY